MCVKCSSSGDCPNYKYVLFTFYYKLEVYDCYLFIFFQSPIGREIRTTVRIRWSFAQMCCTMSLVCPSIAALRTSQFWARSELMNMPKRIVSRQMWSACCNSIPLFWKVTRNVVLRYCPPSWQILDRTLQLQQRGCCSVFDWKSLITHHHPSRTWLPVIFLSFLVWNGRRRTTFWHSELQTSVENWLKAQAAGFYDKGIGKLVPRCEKVYIGASTI